MRTRRDFIVQLGAVTAGSMLLPKTLMAKRNSNKITIVHTNDMHCHFEPFGSDHPKFGNMGGMNRISALVKKIRQQEEQVLFLDSGDFSQGTPYYNFFKGEAVLKLMSVMGYDASIIGNHEFDNGVEMLSKALNYADFPILSSNYAFEQKNMQQKVKTHLVIQKGDVKVGIYALGIDLDSLVGEDNRGGVTVNKQLETALTYEQKLKDEGCDVVICLSHLGYKYKDDQVSDRVIAANTHNTDIILGGHTHSFLDEPQKLINKSGKQVLVNQVGWGALMLGRIDLYFDGKGRKVAHVVSSDNQLIS